MQIAGSICKVCSEAIVLSREGKFCPECKTFVHVRCEPPPGCSACGSRFESFIPAAADPLSDALLPSALRPAGSGGPVFAIVLVLTLVFVLILLLRTHLL